MESTKEDCTKGWNPTALYFFHFLSQINILLVASRASSFKHGRENIKHGFFLSFHQNCSKSFYFQIVLQQLETSM